MIVQFSKASQGFVSLGEGFYGYSIYVNPSEEASKLHIEYTINSDLFEVTKRDKRWTLLTNLGDATQVVEELDAKPVTYALDNIVKFVGAEMPTEPTQVFSSMYYQIDGGDKVAVDVSEFVTTIA